MTRCPDAWWWLWLKFVIAPGRVMDHEEFLIVCLQREVAAREAHGGGGRIRIARFPPARV
jgi:hypothetical protein